MTGGVCRLSPLEPQHPLPAAKVDRAARADVVGVRDAFRLAVYPRGVHAVPVDDLSDGGRSDASKAARKYVKVTLKNRLSCKDRLLRLAGIPDKQAVAMLISDVDRWAKHVRDQRDGVAHASQELPTPDGAGSSYYALEVNIMLVSLVLMERSACPARYNDALSGLATFRASSRSSTGPCRARSPGRNLQRIRALRVTLAVNRGLH